MNKEELEQVIDELITLGEYQLLLLVSILKEVKDYETESE